MIGFLCANIAGYFLIYGMENPFSSNLTLFSNGSKTPSDFVKENQIEILNDRVIIHVTGASIGRYAASGSMIPTLDDKSNGIRIVPESEDEINVGDIITFNDNGSLIVHRVIEKGTDEYGIYFITKGDNNPVSDGKVRFYNIKYKTIGMIW